MAVGAVYFEGTTGLTIAGCQFERLDGNALMLSGYHRGAAVTDSHFSWTGGTAIAAWGRTDELSDGGIHGWDATPGDIPQGTRIEGNIMRESGIWEKQSSCFFQAKTAGTTLLRNLCFNLPRAGVRALFVCPSPLSAAVAHFYGVGDGSSISTTG